MDLGDFKCVACKGPMKIVDVTKRYFQCSDAKCWALGLLRVQPEPFESVVEKFIADIHNRYVSGAMHGIDFKTHLRVAVEHLLAGVK